MPLWFMFFFRFFFAFCLKIRIFYQQTKPFNLFYCCCFRFFSLSANETYRKTQTIDPTPTLDIINCQRMHQWIHNIDEQNAQLQWPFQLKIIWPNQCLRTVMTMMENGKMIQPVSISTTQNPIEYHSIQIHRNAITLTAKISTNLIEWKHLCFHRIYL